MPVRIVSDSTADLSPEIVRELGISIVPMYVRFGEENYRDGIDISHDEFYEKLMHSRLHPNTSQPTPDDFARVYRELSKETREIVSIHVSNKLSGTCSAALQGKELSATGCDIRVVDSKSVSMGVGLPVMLAARLANAGESLQKITDEVKQAIANTQLFGTLDTLRYLLLGGRIGKTKALLGSVLNVKPVLTMRDGELVPIGNARTRAKGIERLFDIVRNTVGIQELAVVHSTTPDEASSLRERLSSLIDSSHIYMARLGPALGVHGGPGTLIVTFRKKSLGLKDTDGKGESKTLSEKPSHRKITIPPLHLPRLNLPHR
jgi:DegV family protein with EDD domain